MLKRVFLLPLLFVSLMSLPASATEQISFSVARDGLTSDVVENVLIKVLANRRWNIIDNNDQKIEVSLHKRGTEANLHLLFDEKEVTIVSNSYCRSAPVWPDFKGGKNPCYPGRWINNIKKDTMKSVRQVNLSKNTTKAPKPTIKQRLIELRLLHEEGLITTTQYEVKQKTLLEEL